MPNFDKYVSDIVNDVVGKIVKEETEKMANMPSAIIVTLPKSIKWKDYEKELNAVKDYSQVMNFKVPSMPKNIGYIKRCYIVYDGYVRGWQKVVGHLENTEFNCTTTGKGWSGNFIQRSGPFHKIVPIPMKGFMGWRYFDENNVQDV